MEKYNGPIAYQYPAEIGNDAGASEDGSTGHRGTHKRSTRNRPGDRKAGGLRPPNQEEVNRLIKPVG